VPFALVGGIAALWVRGMNLNLSASIGFIALFGVAMLNGVLVLDRRGLVSRPTRSLTRAEGTPLRLRSRLCRFRAKSVTYVLGTICYPCLRFGQDKKGLARQV
jgi:cobalt-zinc-cadmium resistance protein CzcA